jgi:hypothetical protein
MDIALCEICEQFLSLSRFHLTRITLDDHSGIIDLLERVKQLNEPIGTFNRFGEYQCGFHLVFLVMDQVDENKWFEGWFEYDHLLTQFGWEGELFSYRRCSLG